MDDTEISKLNEQLVVKRLDLAIETAVEDLSVNGPDVVMEYVLEILRRIRDG